MDELTLFQNEFNPLFTAALRHHLATIPAEANPQGILSESLLAYCAAGKRLRPYITYVASGGTVEALSESSLLPLLFGVELYHTFALIHDDLMDRSETRHGVPCLHAQHGSSIAILIGDLCLSWAHDSIASMRDDPYISALFSALAEETMIGQLLDLARTQSTTPSVELLDRTIEYKTARYTFIYPLFLGRACAERQRSEPVAALVRFGRALGHAFQRIDDLADVVRDTEQQGRAPCGDVRGGITTHLWHYAMTHASPAQQQTGSMLFGNQQASPDAIRQFLVETGALVHETDAIAALIDQAGTALIALHDSARWLPLLSILKGKLSMH